MLISRVSFVILFYVATAVLFIFTPRAIAQARITADELTDEHVRAAIDAIVQELYNRKDPERFWDPATVPGGESTRQEGGYTALTVLALLYAGQSYQDPRLRDAVEYLAHFEMRGTYAVSLRAAVWAKLPEKFRPNLVADTQWLLEGFSEQAAGWDYVQKPTVKRRDNSIAQFGALGLWEAAKRGVPVDSRYWQALEQGYLTCQLADGGWNYEGEADSPPRGSMTAAGLATLYITQDFLHANDFVRLSPGRTNPNERSIGRALTWMDDRYAPDENPGGIGDYYYYAYGVERIGLAGGIKYFGGHDWYREMAAELINRLCIWDEQTRTMNVHRNLRGRGRSRITVRYLTFSLMFLSRGRVPVALNKLQLPGVAWNNRPRDVANLTQWITGITENDLSWQIVNIDSAPEEWLDAPMVYLASHERLTWLADLDVNAAQLKREVRHFLEQRATGARSMDERPPKIPSTPELRALKRYLDLGGLLFAVNEGSSRSFADSVEQVGTLMYPQYDWRPLPDDHWAYTLHFPVKGRKPRLRALSNGVRELIILCPTTDLAGTFQGRTMRNAAHFQTAANIYFYASELNRPRPRLAQHATAPTDASPTGSTVSVARALYPGNWKPEPLALDVLASHLAEFPGRGLRVLDRPLHAIHEVSPRPDLVLVSGTSGHEFTDAQREAIRAYLEGDEGIILFETPGGGDNGAFTVSAERMMTDLIGAPIRLLSRAPVITGAGIRNATDCSRIEYRPYARDVFGSRESGPRLRGMEIAGRIRVLFSREDLTHGLLDQPCWGIVGYSPQSARELMTNILLYAGGSAR